MEYTFKQAEAADMCQRIIPQDWRSEVRWGGKLPSKAHRSCGTTPTENEERQARYKPYQAVHTSEANRNSKRRASRPIRQVAEHTAR